MRVSPISAPLSMSNVTSMVIIISHLDIAIASLPVALQDHHQNVSKEALLKNEFNYMVPHMPPTCLQSKI
jgi:hypothetical protein